MTTASITTQARRLPAAAGQTKLTLLADDGTRVVLPFAPPAATQGSLGARWEEVARDGQRAPLLIFAGQQLATLDLEATVVDTRNPDRSVELYLLVLTELARSSRRLWIVNYGATVGYPWQIVDFSAASTAREYGTNAVAGFTATLSLKAASGIAGVTSPLTANPPAIPVPVLRTVTVKPGETPGQVARRAYGSSGKLARLMAANDIRDPREFQVGQVLIVA